MENSKTIKVEVCATSINSAVMANDAGADRIELCDNISEGGTTPSAGAIAFAVEKLNLETWVMVRPRGGDFMYNQSEFNVIMGDILIAKNIGAHGIVTGILQSDGRIDFMKMIEIIEIAKPLKVAFHRAFDMVIDPFMALAELIDLGVCRILTSGQQNKAVEGVEVLTKLVDTAKGKIEIMAGAGVNDENVSTILDSGVDAIHLSGSSMVKSNMIHKPSKVVLNDFGHEYDFNWKETNLEKIQNVIRIVKSQA